MHHSSASGTRLPSLPPLPTRLLKRFDHFVSSILFLERQIINTTILTCFCFLYYVVKADLNLEWLSTSASLVPGLEGTWDSFHSHSCLLCVRGCAVSAITQRIKVAQWSTNEHALLHPKLLGQGSLVSQFSVTNAVPGSGTKDKLKTYYLGPQSHIKELRLLSLRTTMTCCSTNTGV